MGRVDDRMWTREERIAMDLDNFHGRDDPIGRVEENQFENDDEHDDRYVSFL